MSSVAEIQKTSQEAFYRETISSNLNSFAIDLLITTATPLTHWVKHSIGRESTEIFVPGRDKTEDVQIEIDQKAEKFISIVADRLSEKYGFSLSILSEHNNYEVGNKENPRHTLVLDPIENSDEYRRKLPTPPYSQFQLYNTNNKPIRAGAVNLATGEMYLALEGTNYYYHPELKKLIPMPKPREVTSIKDGHVAIASYDAKSKYAKPFEMLFEKFKEDAELLGGSRHGKGGSHSYVDLATGAIALYPMFIEPRGETDAAHLFALNAGCKVVEADLQTGEYQDYKFDPNKQYERTPLLIAGRSKELIKESISYYMQAKIKWETADFELLKGIYYDYLSRMPAVADVLLQIFPKLKAA